MLLVHVCCSHISDSTVLTCGLHFVVYCSERDSIGKCKGAFFWWSIDLSKYTRQGSFRHVHVYPIALDTASPLIVVAHSITEYHAMQNTNAETTLPLKS